jgi:cytochrome c biogenesis protein
MAHEVGTPPVAPPIAAGRAAAQPAGMDRVDAVLEGLWHILTSMRVAMIFMIILALFAMLGSLIIQAPVGVLGDSTAKAEWLNEIRPMQLPVIGWMHSWPLVGPVIPDLKYGDVLGLFNFLQLFEIFRSIIFLVLVTGLTISLIACSVHRMPGVWRTATKPRIDVGPKFFEHAPQHESVVVHMASAETFDAVRAVLRRKRYRTVSLDDGAIHLYGDRFRWVGFASLAGHLSLVFILAGAILGGAIGYRDSQFVIAEGATLPLGSEPGVTIKLVDFKDSYYAATGSPEDYASQVILYKNGAQVASQTVRVNEPLQYNGTTIYQAFFGQAAVMTVKDKTGAVVSDQQGVPLAWQTTDGNRPIGSFTIPGTSTVAWVVGTTGTSDTQVQPGQVQLELYAADGSALATSVLTQGAATAVGDFTFTFDRESQFAGLNIARDPGSILVWIGAFMLFAGFVLVFMLPQRRVWARISPLGGGTSSVLSVASLGRRDAALGTDFEDLVTDIRAALQAPASQA